MITSIFYILYIKSLLVVAKMIGSLGKNDSLYFHSKLFCVWLWPLQSFECDYDHHSTVAFGSTQI